MSSADEVDDLDLVAVVHRSAVERLALDDREVVLDGDAPGVDLQLREKFVHGEGTGEVVRLAVQGNPQGLAHSSAQPAGARWAGGIDRREAGPRRARPGRRDLLLL